MSRNLSTTSVPQTAFAVKITVLPETLPEGVTVADDGLTIRKLCPACGGWIVVENTAEALRWIAAKNRVCRACDEDMAANFLSWEPMPEAGDYDYSLAWQEFRREFCHE